MRFTLFVTIALVITSLTGCGGSGLQLAEVTGKVTLDGKAVPKARIEFVPVAAGGSPSLGVTDQEGNYRLAFSQDEFGAMLGKHSVKITTKKLSKDELPEDGSNAEQVFVAIPKKYSAPDALTAEVKAGKNSINFDLDSK